MARKKVEKKAEKKKVVLGKYSEPVGTKFGVKEEPKFGGKE